MGFRRGLCLLAAHANGSLLFGVWSHILLDTLKVIERKTATHTYIHISVIYVTMGLHNNICMRYDLSKTNKDTIIVMYID